MATYEVKIFPDKTNQETRIIKAKSQAAAINHALQGNITARALSSDELADLVMAGNLKIEDAMGRADEPEEAPNADTPPESTNEPKEGQ